MLLGLLAHGQLERRERHHSNALQFTGIVESNPTRLSNMPLNCWSVAALLLAASAAAAQQPFRHFSESVESRFSSTDPIVSYVLRVDSADLSGFDVELRLRNASDTVRLAMMHHPEYDDRFFRFVENVRAEGARGATITHVDSAV